MKFLFYIIILFFLFNVIQNNKKDITLDFLNKLDKYNSEYIISETINIHLIQKIKNIVYSINNNEELYKYDFDVLDYIINNINNNIINKKKTKILNETETKVLDDFLLDLYKIRFNSKVKCNTYYKNINRNKKIIILNKIQYNHN